MNIYKRVTTDDITLHDKNGFDTGNFDEDWTMEKTFLGVFKTKKVMTKRVNGNVSNDKKVGFGNG